MTHRRGLHWFVLAIASVATAGRAVAASPEAQAAAEEWSANGKYLFDNGAYGSALREFERAYEAAPSPALLYQMVLTYQALDKPVEALETIDQLLPKVESLKPDQATHARALKEDLQNRVGKLSVTVNVPASIEIDGEQAGEAPLESPLSVAAGEHFIAIVAPGHKPVRRTFSVSGQGSVDLAFELEPVEEKLGGITVYSQVMGAEVRVDDEVVGRTPLARPIALLPGKHTVEIQRPGYMSGYRTLTLADGAYTTVAFTLEQDESDRAAWGRLTIEAGKGALDVTVDGRRRGSYKGPFSLPAGKHLVKIERPKFEPFERTVEISIGGETEMKVSLRPTAKATQAKMARVDSRRNWSIATIVAGALVAGGSIALTVWSNRELGSREDKLNALQRNAAPGGNGTCDPENNLSDFAALRCRQDIEAAQADVDKYGNLRLGGIIGVVGGAAIIGVGTWLLVTGPSADAEEPVESAWIPTFAAGPTGATFGLRGRF
jgi:hypothetical protein